MEQRIREKCTPLEINTLFLSPVFFIPLVLTKANKTAVISEITIPMQMIVCILSEYFCDNQRVFLKSIATICLMQSS